VDCHEAFLPNKPRVVPRVNDHGSLMTRRYKNTLERGPPFFAWGCFRYFCFWALPRTAETGFFTSRNGRDVQASRLIAVISLRRLDARDGVGGVFDRGRHVMGVGMNDGVGIAHDRDKCDRRCEVLP
jgi:hypothetical protein